MPPAHPAPGRGRLRPYAPKHSLRSSRILPYVMAGVLVYATAFAGTAVVVQTRPGTVKAFAPPPAVPQAQVPVFTSGDVALRAVRQRTKARPPIVLGPGPAGLQGELTRYCRDHGTAELRDGTWVCAGLFTATAIDMDRACRYLYTGDAWAGMVHDDDPKSWRCYRDAS